MLKSISSMGVYQALPNSFDLKSDIQGNEAFCKTSSESLWNRVLEARSKRRWIVRKQRGTRNNRGQIRTNKPRRILMKKKAHLEGSSRPAKGIQRRVRTLKNLIPNSESTGLDGLFRETADYILALEMRVKVMQIMVKVLGGSEE
ncbi:transcription factor UPBEAT1-like [Mangifera indica]|uniref:transcription factor UPBEAT1-like n=1 Tax=Mangifera indica TaxID=29780 RepID=UPI001CF9A597|nr:transcription factor UPBEAT1-like [Mangifera indica]